MVIEKFLSMDGVEKDIQERSKCLAKLAYRAIDNPCGQISAIVFKLKRLDKNGRPSKLH